METVYEEMGGDVAGGPATDGPRSEAISPHGAVVDALAELKDRGGAETPSTTSPPSSSPVAGAGSPDTTEETLTAAASLLEPLAGEDDVGAERDKEEEQGELGAMEEKEEDELGAMEEKEEEPGALRRLSTRHRRTTSFYQS